MLEPPVPPRPDPPRRPLAVRIRARTAARALGRSTRPRRRAARRRGRRGLRLVPARRPGGAGATGSVPTTATTERRAAARRRPPTTSTATGASSWSTSPARSRAPGSCASRAGARVVDAIDAAGGGLPDADLDRLNLAAKVADGQRVAVALIGAPAPVEAGRRAAATGTGERGRPRARSTSTPRRRSQLEELPGIGPSLAAAIIAEREKRGGFQAVSELQDVRGIGELRYADIKDLVSV